MRLRVTLVLLGAWLSLSLAMGAVATINFGTVDRVLEPGYRDELARVVAPRTLAEERPILRYLASELNRRFFRAFAWVQVGLAVALAILVAGQPGFGTGGKLALGMAIGLLAVNLAALMPAVLRLGPPLDFAPRPVPPGLAADHARFLRVHGYYMALELARLVCLAIALGSFLRVREWSVGGLSGPGRRPSPAIDSGKRVA